MKIFIKILLPLMTALLSVSVCHASVIEEGVTVTELDDDVHVGSGIKNESELKEIEKQEEERRKYKEKLVTERVADALGQAEKDISVYYCCYDNMTDYVLAEYNNVLYVYYLRITSDGEYFLSDVPINSGVQQKFISMMDESNRHTTEMFWNKVSLSKPEEEIKPLRPTDQNGVMLVPYFNQGAGFYQGNDEWTATDWPSVQFNVNGHTMQEAGCGFFSTAMALSYMKQQIIAPTEFKENGQYIADEGSAVTVGVATAETYGVYAYFTSNINDVKEALRNGHPVMEHVGPSVFTRGGHYILLVGYTKDGMFAVNDPGNMSNSYFYNGVTFDEQTILNAAKDISTAFTIFE